MSVLIGAGVVAVGAPVAGCSVAGVVAEGRAGPAGWPPGCRHGQLEAIADLSPGRSSLLWSVVVVATGVALLGLRRWRRSRGRRARAVVLFGPVAPVVAAGPAGGSAGVRKMTARLTAHRGLAPAAAGTGAGISVAVLLDGLLGTPLGLLLGACSAAAAWRAVGKRPGRGRGEKAELREAGRQLPFAAELLAACLAAGSRPREAAWAVGASLGGPLGERLVRVCQELRLGAEPDAAWRCVAEVEGGRRLARCLEQAEQSGAPVVDEISRQAATARADRARAGAARARQAAVHVTAPLGLCFLPAFLLATVVPVVIGLGQRLS